MIDKFLRAWFVKHHGEGEAHQADLYRCLTCGALITWKKIRVNDVCCAGRLVPTQPKFKEVLRLFLFPWTI